MRGVREYHLLPERRTPYAFEAGMESADVAEFFASRRTQLRDSLLEHGALLFRGFSVYTIQDFERFLNAVGEDRLGYVYGTSPRSVVGDRIFTSTEHPAALPIELHNECSYQRQWPRMIAFCCIQPAASGGETPLADMSTVTRAIGPDIVGRFEELQVRYVRHYHPYVDVPWQKVFETADRNRVAEICAERDIDSEWVEADVLRTSQTCQGTVRHPQRRERIFFNQAHLFHVSGLPGSDSSIALSLFGPDRLPKNAYFGDGAEIPAEDLFAIRAALRREEVTFAWRRGDVLLLDNMQVAHGRRPFTGIRRIVVGLLGSYSPPWPPVQV